MGSPSWALGHVRGEDDLALVDPEQLELPLHLLEGGIDRPAGATDVRRRSIAFPSRLAEG
jgi:hypothetical protein